MRAKDDRFPAYRDKPGRETLRALLSAHQATVFNLSFQVLRSAADAEDAAQETLLEIVRGIDRIREPRAFKRWLCRVALHTALDHLRRRARRARHEEARAAMKPAMPDPSADAIHEALANLEDEDRCLLVEKYFERATLEEIGAREGVTAAAVGKRIDRAKERLKRRLSQAGLAALVPGVDSMLDSVRPATAAPPLNLEAALAGAPSALLTVKAAAILSFVLLLGAGGAYAWKRNSASDRIPAAPAIASNLVESNGLGEIATSEVADIEAESERRPSLAELLSRLARFRTWYDEFKPPVEGPTFSMDDPEETLKKVRAELVGVRALIFRNPRVFLGWMALPESARCVIDLMAATLSEPPTFRAALNPAEPEILLQEFADIPSELTDGLLGLLHAGNESVLEAILKFALTLKDAPHEWRARYLALVSHEREAIWELAVRALLTTGKPVLNEIQGLAGSLDMKKDFDRASLILRELCRLGTPESRDVILTGLESGRIPDDPQTTALVVQYVFMFDPIPGAEFEERSVRLLLSSLRRAKDEYTCSEVVAGALNLPPRLAKPIVARVATDGLTERLRRAAARVLEEAALHEENWRSHRHLWRRSMQSN